MENYMKKCLLLFLVTGLLAGTSVGQVKFQRTYGGSGSDEGQSVVVTSDSGFVIAGHTTSNSSLNSTLFLMKLNKKGDMKWNKVIAVSTNDYVRSLAQTRDSGFILCGYSVDKFGTTSPLVVKTTSLGDVQWARTYSNSSMAYAFCAQQTHDGGYILAGYGQLIGNGWDGLLIRTDSLGNVKWQNFYGGPTTDGLDYVNELADGSFMAAGWNYEGGVDPNSWLLKVSSEGTELWSNNYGGTGNEDIQAAIPSRKGGFLAAGVTTSYGGGSNNILLIKTDSTGNARWMKSYGGLGDERAQASMIENPDGSIVITGYTSSYGAGGNGMFLLKTDSAGSLLKFKVYGGSGDEDGRAIRRTPDNGYVIVGWTASYGSGNHDVYVVKTDSNGSSGCNDVTATPTVTSIALNSILRAASNFERRDTAIFQSGGEFAATTLCSSDTTTGIDEAATSHVPAKFGVSQNYPNPFNPSTSFDVEVPEVGFVTVLIYNEIGQLVDKLVQSDLNPGRHRIDWKPEGLSSGIYYYQLQIDNTISMSRKMILLK